MVTDELCSTNIATCWNDTSRMWAVAYCYLKCPINDHFSTLFQTPTSLKSCKSPLFRPFRRHHEISADRHRQTRSISNKLATMEPTTTSAAAPPLTEPAATTPNPPSEDTPLTEGDTCDILWRDGSTVLKAKVIERRLLTTTAMANSNSKQQRVVAASLSAEPPAKKAKAEDEPLDHGRRAGDYEYYVHYVEHDR